MDGTNSKTLIGREHLQSYGRVKNLIGPALTQAVENSLRRVNLVRGGVGDKEVSEYSRSEKRRLSVAILLIENPQACLTYVVSIQLLKTLHIFVSHATNGVIYEYFVRWSLWKNLRLD
ncbi:hypothetical protein AAG906_017756 [Vitis piasezkii]